MKKKSRQASRLEHGTTTCAARIPVSELAFILIDVVGKVMAGCGSWRINGLGGAWMLEFEIQVCSFDFSATPYCEVRKGELQWKEARTAIRR